MQYLIHKNTYSIYIYTYIRTCMYWYTYMYMYVCSHCTFKSVNFLCFVLKSTHVDTQLERIETAAKITIKQIRTDTDLVSLGITVQYVHRLE